MHRSTRPRPLLPSRLRGLAAAAGQGTVEYVALILLVAGVLGAVVTWGQRFEGKSLGQKITTQLERAISETGEK